VPWHIVDVLSVLFRLWASFLGVEEFSLCDVMYATLSLHHAFWFVPACRPHLALDWFADVFPVLGICRFALDQPFTVPQAGVFMDPHQYAVQQTGFPHLKVEDIQSGMSPSQFPGGNMSSVTGSAEDAPHGSTDDDQNMDIAGSVQQHATVVEVPQPPDSPMPHTQVYFGRQT
jgi:hypothetical protein